MERKINIGVSLYIRNNGQSFWENGIFQNVLYLVRLLERLDFVNKAYLVIETNGDESHIKNFLANINVNYLMIKDCSDKIDFAVEFGVTFSPDWIKNFRTKRRGKVVAMRVGNDYHIDLTKTLHDKDHAALFSHSEYDEIWTLPQYEQVLTDYYEIGFGAPVRIMPHIWSPELLDMFLRFNPSWKKFGYEPGKSKWRLGILEPNIYLIKTYLTPLLIAERTFRENPDIIENVNIFNSEHIKEKIPYKAFVNKLALNANGKIINSPRYITPFGVPNFLDAIISHQTFNAQNYIYYEALYGNYPLIHNSHLLKNVGYYYPDFDAKAGKRAVIEAFNYHDKHLDEIKEKNREFLKDITPDSIYLQKEYGEAILNILRRN